MSKTRRFFGLEGIFFLLSLLCSELGLSDLSRCQSDDHDATTKIQSAVKFEKISISIFRSKPEKHKRATVELAVTDEQRARGLMCRRELKGIDGMLFDFGDEKPLSFWMKNTFLPLSIGFFNGDGKLLNVQDMVPVQSEIEIPKTYKCPFPARYALETKQGWFEKNEIKVGDTLKIFKSKRVQGP